MALWILPWGLSAEVRHLTVSGDSFVDLRGVSGLRGLRTLHAAGPSLASLNGLDLFSSLEGLDLGGSALLTNLQGLAPEARLRRLSLEQLPALVALTGLRFSPTVQHGGCEGHWSSKS